MNYPSQFLLVLNAWMLIGSAFASDMPPPENQGTPSELVALAVKFEHAEGVPQDYNKAVDLYCRAARSGYADAQYALGWMYANGRGVAKSDSVAAQLFSLASQQGHVHATEILRHIKPVIQDPLPFCMLPEEPAGNSVTAQSENNAASEAMDATEEVTYLKGPIFNLVHQLAPKYKIDPKLALAIISVESGFNIYAKSPKNAQGLMQLIPETAQRFHVKNAFDPTENIKGGLAYLQWLLAYFKGNVPLVAAAYNAGEHTVEKFNGIPPYPETQAYVRKITRIYKKTTHPYRTGQAKISSIAMLSADKL